MKKDRNYKVRLHNSPIGDKVYLISAESHLDAYNRFAGIFLNNGFYHCRAAWRPLRRKPSSIKDRFIFKRVTQRTVRTYFFYPTTFVANWKNFKGRPQEAAIEVIKLK